MDDMDPGRTLADVFEALRDTGNLPDVSLPDEPMRTTGWEELRADALANMTPEQRAEYDAEYARLERDVLDAYNEAAVERRDLSDRLAAEGSFMDLIRELPDTTDIDDDGIERRDEPPKDAGL